MDPITVGLLAVGGAAAARRARAAVPGVRALDDGDGAHVHGWVPPECRRGESTEDYTDRVAVDFCLNAVLERDPPGVGREWADNHALTDYVNEHGAAQIALARERLCDHTEQTSEAFIANVSCAVAEHALDDYQDATVLRVRREAAQRKVDDAKRRAAERASVQARVDEAKTLAYEADIKRRHAREVERGHNPFVPAPSARKRSLVEIKSDIAALEAKTKALLETVEDVEYVQTDQRRVPLYTDDIVPGGYLVPFG